MKPAAFKPRNDRERLAFEAGRAQGLREAIQLHAQHQLLDAIPPTAPAPPELAEVPEPSAEVLRLEDLLVGLGFTLFTDEDNPARQWKRGEEEVAIDEASTEEQVRWFVADKDEPDTMTIALACRRAMDEGMHR